MGRKSFADLTTSAQLLVKALTERGETLPVGVTAEMRDKLAAAHKKAVDINAEQEKMKAQLKEKTIELDKTLTEIEESYSLMKKYIKMGVQKELWGEFGFHDKR